VIKARESAWLDLHDVEVPADADPQYNLTIPDEIVAGLKKIHLEQGEMKVVAGGIGGQAEGKLELGPSSVVGNLPTIDRSHHLFASAWDDATISFPSRAHHGPLQMDERFKNFALEPENLDLKAFSKLIPTNR
jgi:hypothetical protein